MSDTKVKTSLKKIISLIAGTLVAAGILGVVGYQVITGEEYNKDAVAKIEQSVITYSDSNEVVVPEVVK